MSKRQIQTELALKEKCPTSLVLQFFYQSSKYMRKNTTIKTKKEPMQHSKSV